MPTDKTEDLRKGDEPTAASGAAFLSDEISTFLQSGLAIIIGVVGPDGRARTGRALAVRVVGPDHLRVLYPTVGNTDVTATARSGGPIAITFSAPMSHRTLQVKASSCQGEDVEVEDRAVAQRQSDAFAGILTALGYAPDFARAISDDRSSTLCALSLRVEAAFEQTPGPGAGRSI